MVCSSWIVALVSCFALMTISPPCNGQSWNDFRAQSMYIAIDYARDKEHISHSEFANILHARLSGIFNTRDWLVVVYDPIRHYEHHTIRQRGGHMLFRQNGRNIIISSVESTSPHCDLEGGRRSMNTVSVKYSTWLGDRPRHAEDVFNDLDITTAMRGAGVIRSYSDVGYAHNGRGFYEVQRGKYYMYVWG